MKESPLTIPKKNSGRDFDFPPRPSLKRPKEGPRPFLWKPSWGLWGSCGGRGTIGRGRAAGVVGPYGGEGRGMGVGCAVVQGSLLCGRRGWGWPGSSGAGDRVVEGPAGDGGVGIDGPDFLGKEGGNFCLTEWWGSGMLTGGKKGVAGAIGAVWLVITAFWPGRYQRAARLLPGIFAAAESRFFSCPPAPDRRNFS